MASSTRIPPEGVGLIRCQLLLRENGAPARKDVGKRMPHYSA
jgi:hypothetical protein